jgi:hypothetical protein
VPDNAASPTLERAPKKERYERLFDALKANHGLFNDIARHTAGFLLIALGWLITSDRSGSLLAAHSSVALVAWLVITALWIIQTGVLLAIRSRTSDLLSRLEQLDYAPAGDAKHFRITVPHLLSSVVADGLLFLSLLGLLYTVGRAASSS